MKVNHVGVRGILVLTAAVTMVAGCQGQSQQQSAPLSSPTESAEKGIDNAVVQRWWQWRQSALHGSPEPAGYTRGCAKDPGSERWFADGIITVGQQSWTCQVPAGMALVVVPTAINTPEKLSCADGIAARAPVNAEASMDGAPIALTYSDPIPNDLPTDVGGPKTYVCARWGTTPPLTPGRHTIVLTAQVQADQQPKGTITLTVEVG